MSDTSTDDPEKKLLDELLEILDNCDLVRLKQFEKAGKWGNNEDEWLMLLLIAITIYGNRNKIPDSNTYDCNADNNGSEIFDYLLRECEIDYAYDELIESPECAVKLFRCGCGVHKRLGYVNGYTHLHCAVINDYNGVVKLMLKHGIGEDPYNDNGETPLYCACQLGHIDIIYTLLANGADANTGRPTTVGNCFVLATKEDTKSEVRKILLEEMEKYKKQVNLLTVLNIMETDSYQFYMLLHIVDKISFLNVDLNGIWTRLHRFNPQAFKVFIDECDYIFLELFRCRSFETLGTGIQTKKEFDNFTENIFALFDSTIVEDVVKSFNPIPSRVGAPIVRIIKACEGQENELDMVTQFVCCLLSHGVDLTTEAFHEIYFRYGYCPLFRILLHMDTVSSGFLCGTNICYDFNLTPMLLIPRLVHFFKYYNLLILLPGHRHDGQYLANLHLIIDHFASSQLKSILIHNNTNERILERVRNLPDVPKLTELARNEVRSYIISKYETKTCRQFHTILDRFPVPYMIKEMISYQRKIY